MDDLYGGAVTPPSCATSVPLPAELTKDIEGELKTSSDTIAVPEMGTCDLFSRPIGTHETLSTQVKITIPVGLHSHSRYSRSDVACNQSAQGSRRRSTGSTKQISANTDTIRKWISQHQVVTTVPSTLPIGPKRQSAWITMCAFKLAALASDLPYPVACLVSMQGKPFEPLGILSTARRYCL